MPPKKLRLKVPGDAVQKNYKSRRSEFSYVNEFITERIKFFGKNTRRAKRSGRKNEL